MPKEVDHPGRRRELADAAGRVIARNGLAGTTLADVAEEAGWSIGSIRYYFPSKDELVASALWRGGGRLDGPVPRRTARGGARAARPAPPPHHPPPGAPPPRGAPGPPPPLRPGAGGPPP